MQTLSCNIRSLLIKGFLQLILDCIEFMKSKYTGKVNANSIGPPNWVEWLELKFEFESLFDSDSIAPSGDDNLLYPKNRHNLLNGDQK